MHQRISKKIIIYLFLFIILVTVNNINFLSFNLPQISKLNIYGLNNFEKKEFKEDFDFIKNENILLLDKAEVTNKIFSNKLVEDLFVFKKYPSELEILIKKTSFIAIVKKNNQNYYIGSNGNFIPTKETLENLPFIFGDIDPQDFFKSKRWNIETKNGLIVKLPLDQIDLALNTLSKIMIEKQFRNKKIIDLRIKGQIIIND